MTSGQNADAVITARWRATDAVHDDACRPHDTCRHYRQQHPVVASSTLPTITLSLTMQTCGAGTTPYTGAANVAAVHVAPALPPHNAPVHRNAAHGAACRRAPRRHVRLTAVGVAEAHTVTITSGLLQQEESRRVMTRAKSRSRGVPGICGEAGHGETRGHDWPQIHGADAQWPTPPDVPCRALPHRILLTLTDPFRGAGTLPNDPAHPEDGGEDVSSTLGQ